MTTDKAKFYLSICKPEKFTVDCAKQYEEAFSMALSALDDVEKYKGAIKEIKAEMKREQTHDCVGAYGLELALAIIKRYLKR